MSYADRRKIEDSLKAKGVAGLHAVEAEVELIGAALGHAERCDDAFDRLADGHFGDPVAGRIWGAISHLRRRAMAISPATVRDVLGLDQGFDEWGGVERLSDLRELASAYGLAENVDAVADRSARRALRDLTGDIGAKVLDTAAGDAVALLGELERRAAEIAATGETRDHWLHPSDMILEALAAAEARGGVLKHPSGLDDLDKLTGGLHDGELTLIGARPGTGKTVAGQSYAREEARAGRGTVFISLEMAAHPMGARLACDLAHQRAAISFGGLTSNVTMDRFARFDLKPWEVDRLREAAATVASWPLLYDVRPGLTMAQIEAVVRRAFRKWEAQGIAPGLVVIDHLGKVRPSKDRRGSMHQEMADVSGDTAEMAKRLGVPVLGLVQLNRQVEGREDKRPILSDLRQAGELEQDARQVIFLHRPEQYLRDPADTETPEQSEKRIKALTDARNKLWWVVEKNSNGPRGQALTFCEVGCSAVRDWNV